MSTYPVAIREHLAASRAAGLTFPLAWQLARGTVPIPAEECWTGPQTFEQEAEDGSARSRRNVSADEEGTITFMRRHMEAAYSGSYGRAGTFRPEPPTPAAIALSTQRNASHAYIEPMPTCKSGDGCPREATMGRFGPMWCAMHGTELERCREKESAWNSTPRTVRTKPEAEAA